MDYSWHPRVSVEVRSWAKEQKCWSHRTLVAGRPEQSPQGVLTKSSLTKISPHPTRAVHRQPPLSLVKERGNESELLHIWGEVLATPIAPR